MFMKKAILVAVLLLVIGAAGVEIVSVARSYLNREVRVEKRDEIVYQGKTLHRWSDDMRSSNPSVRQAAYEALINVPPKDGQYMIAGLEEALEEKDNVTRCRAGAVIAHIINNVRIPGPVTPAVAPHLVEVLKDPDPKVRCQGAETLAMFGPAIGGVVTVVPALTDLAKNDTDEEVRKAAAAAIEKIRPSSRAPKAK
jgi:hypothetical protein